MHSYDMHVQVVLASLLYPVTDAMLVLLQWA